MAKKINIIANLVDKQLKKQLTDIEKGKYKIDVDVNSEKINNTNKNMKQLGNTTTSTNRVFGKLKDTITNTFSASRITMTGFLAVLTEIHKAGQNAKQTIIELDKAITDLSVATNMSRESVSSLLQDYNKFAKEMKSTTLDVSQAADDYLRAGKSMSESQELIRDSVMLSKLGQIDSSAATEDLLATMNGFNMSVEEVGKALDAMVAVDLEAATSAGDIATALKYCASSADVAGVSFNKLVGILSSVQDKTQQSAETIGTFANTLLSRYRDVKIGNYISDDGEDLSDYESVLKSVGISLRDSENEFRNYEYILQDMADKWDTLSSVQQAAIAKTASGVRQQNRFYALMEGYNNVLKLTEVAADSAGTAIEKYNKSYVDSLQAKQNTLQASFESMIMNSDFSEVYAGILDATNALVEFMYKTNALKGVMSGLAVGGAIKAFVGIKSGITQAYIALNKFQNAMNLVGKAKISTKEFDRLLLLSNGLSKSQMKLIVSTNALSVAQKKELLIASGLSEEEATLQLQTWKMTSANTGLTASTTSASNAFKALWTTIKANPLMPIISGITLGVSAWQKYKQAIEDAVSSANEAANTYSEQASSIDEMVSKYQELREQLIAAKGNEEETYNVKQQLLELQTELNEQFGNEYTKLNLVTDAYKNQTDAIKAYNKEASQKYLNENRKGIEEATKQMEKDTSYYLGSMNGLVDASELEYLDKISAIALDNNIEFTENGFAFIGNANEASDSINTFMNQIKDLQKEAGNTSSVLSGIFDGILDNSGEALADADSIIEKYSEIYEQAKLAEIASDDKLSSGYSDLINAVSAYNDAVLKSENPYDDENVRNAYDNLQTVKQGIEDNEEEWGKYSDIVEEAYNQADTSSYSFYDAIEKNKEGIGNLSNELKGLSTIDLQAMADDGNNGDAFDKLCNFAKEYGLEVQNVIDLLVELGYVQGEIADASKQEDLTPSFSYDKLSDIPQKLAEVENAYKTAQDALDSYNEKGYYSMDVIDSILSLEDEYINVLVDQNGQLQINESSMNKLAAIKIEAAKASIYQETCEELVRIKTLDTALAAQELALMNGTLTQSAYETAKALYEEVVAMGGANAALGQNVWDSATKKVKVLDNQLKSLNKNTYSVGKSAMYDSAKKAAEEAEKATKEYIEAYLEFQKQSLESGRIDYQTYSRDVANFLKDMYDKGKIAAKDYHDYTKQMLEVQLSIYKKVLSAVTNRIDKEIDGIESIIDGIEKQNDALEKQQELMENAAQAVSDYYQKLIDEIENVNDAIEEQNDKLEEQLSDMEDAIDAVTTYYDSLIEADHDSIDGLNEKNDSIQEQIDKYNSLISVADKLYENEQNALKEQQDSIQESIDALNEENDVLDIQYRKEQALYNLQRAQSQRTKKVFNSTEFVYTTDQNDIRDTQKELQDIETEELVNSLEKEKDALQESIDALQEYRDALGDISDSYEQIIDERNTIDLLGEDYKEKILGVDINDWEELKDRYISANDEMADNTTLIDSLNEKIETWENEKKQWSSLTQSIKDEANKQKAIEQFGADWEKQINEGRFNAYDSFKDNYLFIQSQINDNTETINSNNEKKEQYSQLKAEWDSLTSALSDATNTQAAIQLFGADWEKQINEGRLQSFDAFKNNYLTIQSQINNNQGLIDSYNEKISYYQALKDQWSAIADEYENSVNDQLAAQILGANWETDVLNGRLDVMNSFRSSYIQIQQDIANAAWNSANSQIDAINAVKNAQTTTTQTTGGTANNVGDVPQSTPTIQKPHSQQSTTAVIGNHNGVIGGGIKNTIQRYGTGTKDAEPGVHIVSEDGTEIIRDNYGNAFVAEGEQLHYFEGGETVIKASESSKILANSKNLIPLQDYVSPLYGLNLQPIDYGSMVMSNLNLPDFSKLATVNRDNSTSVSIGEIHLHEVQNVDGLANAIIRELPNKTIQAINRR